MFDPSTLPGFLETKATSRAGLLAARNEHGHWTGELAPSALATATAIFALHRHSPQTHQSRIATGIRWLIDNQNGDGGWGDTPISFSNISTTSLVWAALTVSSDVPKNVIEGTEEWLRQAAGSREPVQLAQSIADRYGKDRTFSVPILTMLALSGRLGDKPWSLIPRLPFEFAAFPQSWYRYLSLPVVSYALPALIAIGQVGHFHNPTPVTPLRWLRNALSPRTLRILDGIQPESGGFLEATPLTAFVAMSLLASGQQNLPVVTAAIAFLVRSQRPDGSWPIDTDLSVWLTSLATNALLQGPADDWPRAEQLTVRDWLLARQYSEVHLYTGAAPGAWSWTDKPGGVPDADDTAGAIIALSKLGCDRSVTQRGLHWLGNLKNGDGGIPTFCQGWGTLPFDRSGVDLTAHALLAAHHAGPWGETQPLLDFLRRSQRADGSWAPLWFGNQHAKEVENLTYGTSRVLRLMGLFPRFDDCLTRGLHYLLSIQNPDGGWGGRAGTPSSIEETALAIEGLAACRNSTPGDSLANSLRRGFVWLIAATDQGTRFPPSPIGFYFANLWYYEKLYPQIMTVAAFSSL